MLDPGRMRDELATFARFCIVGGGGFLVDAGVLHAAVSVAKLTPFEGRAISAPVAILYTFLLNRHWAFKGAREIGLLRAFAAYLSVQGVGLVANLLAYAACIAFAPEPLNGPVAALALASAFALLVNFAGLRLFAFRRRRARGKEVAA